MENVLGLEKYLGLRPTQISYIGPTMKRAFWGNFPHFLMPMQSNVKAKSSYNSPIGSWERSKIPLVCSQAFARACKEALLENEH